MGETVKESVINVGLSNEQSALHGVIANVVLDNQDGFVGEANLYLSNGATWNNEQYGELPVHPPVFILTVKAEMVELN